MRVWLEIHCENETQVLNDCDSTHADNPGALGSTYYKAYGNAEAVARDQGWINRNNRWYCRACKHMLSGSW